MPAKILLRVATFCRFGGHAVREKCKQVGHCDAILHIKRETGESIHLKRDTDELIHSGATTHKHTPFINAVPP
jgi:hypothetical protein